MCLACRRTFQSSTRQTDFATARLGSTRNLTPPVSILYEADRLCNSSPEPSSPPPGCCFNPLRGRQTLQPAPPHVVSPHLRGFQSSTRQTDFATTSVTSRLGSIRWFQSSTRQTDFATDDGRGPVVPPPAVSILYEADRLCNRPRDPRAGPRRPVSILYEADRLCNAATPAPFRESPGCFNPLRGRQTLQPRGAWPSTDRARVSILYEADRLCNLTCGKFIGAP